MCKQNTTITGTGQQTQGSGCNCKSASSGGCSSARSFLALQHERPLGLVHVVDPSLSQVGLPNGKVAELVEHV